MSPSNNGFDWRKAIRKIAPVIGGAISGPIGPLVNIGIATVSEAILGKPDGTEEEVSAAIQKGLSPDAIAALQKQDQDFKIRMQQVLNESEKNRLDAETQQVQEETKQQVAVNVTMQEESRNSAIEAWYQKGWRPYWGFISGTGFGIVVVFICYLAYLGIVNKDHEAIRMIPDLVTSFAELFAIPGAVLGITAWHRGKMQRLRAGEKIANVGNMIKRGQS